MPWNIDTPCAAVVPAELARHCVAAVPLDGAERAARWARAAARVERARIMIWAQHAPAGSRRVGSQPEHRVLRWRVGQSSGDGADVAGLRRQDQRGNASE
jgi:hypothetical protein